MKADLLKTLSLLVVLALVVVLVACGMDCSRGGHERDANNNGTLLKVTNWNVQTFFDGENDGTEYSEFTKSKTWNRDCYMERLSRLCDAIKVMDSDVFVLEELENKGVLQDVANFLAGEWNQKKLYSYACFVRPQGSSIGCGVLSRYPLEELKVHGLDIRSSDETDGTMPSMRPLMKVSVVKDGRSLVLMVNHWKSMSGGKDETEVWRNWQESVLCNQIILAYQEESLERGGAAGAENVAGLAVGDFNRDVGDFSSGNSTGNIILWTMEKGAGGRFTGASDAEASGAVYRDTESGLCTEVVSPWYLSSGNMVEPGSYYFQGKWSRIDNFFSWGKAEIISFYPETQGPWCTEGDFIPKKYELWSGEGYSDHLPVTCLVKF